MVLSNLTWKAAELACDLLLVAIGMGCLLTPGGGGTRPVPADEAERIEREREERLRRRVTPEFLATLTLALKTFGDLGDSVATADFGRWCHEVAGVEISPDHFEPF